MDQSIKTQHWTAINMGFSFKFALLVSLYFLLLHRGSAEQDIPSVSSPDETREVVADVADQEQEQQVPDPGRTGATSSQEQPQPKHPTAATEFNYEGYYRQVLGGRADCPPPIMMPIPGPTGPAGPHGAPGPMGSVGPVGPMGANGPMGAMGRPGNNGNNGMPGMTGPKGQKGAIGLKGEQGYPGISGSPGLPGMVGAQGPTGVVGPTGSRGTAGRTGAKGEPGKIGLPGRDGPMGIPGMDGFKGEAGLPGRDGECNCDDRPRYPSAGPRTSAFSVARTSGLTATNGPITVTFQHVFTNVGEDFDINTGKFNCSVPGVYFFTVNVYKSSAQNFPLVQILKNGEHMAAVIDYGSQDTEDSATNSLILSLSEGDQVWLQLYDGREIYSSHYRFTTFSGFRIA